MPLHTQKLHSMTGNTTQYNKISKKLVDNKQYMLKKTDTIGL